MSGVAAVDDGYVNKMPTAIPEAEILAVQFFAVCGG